MKIGIVGLGLIGGSFGLSLKEAYQNEQIKIIGYDHNSSHQKEALQLGLVDKIAKNFDEIKECDVIILAIPVEGIIKALKSLEGVSKDTTIIDMGSTKERIIKNTPPSIRKNFVAAHPMAGTEKTGPKAAFSELYKDKIVVFCNIEESGKNQIKKAKEIFTKLQMKIVYMEAKEHDLHAAYISHMPHAVSFAIANSVMKREDRKNILALAGGGFESMSRLAKSSPQMWGDIFKQNKNNFLLALDALIDEILDLKEMVKSDKWDKVDQWMKDGNKLHNLLK